MDGAPHLVPELQARCCRLLRRYRLCCSANRDGWFGSHILYRNSNGRNASVESLWRSRAPPRLSQTISRYPSLTAINKGWLTPNSRCLCRHHHHLLCHCLRLPLHLLPHLALVEGGYRQLEADPQSLSRDILGAFCSCPMVRLLPCGSSPIVPVYSATTSTPDRCSLRHGVLVRPEPARCRHFL